MIFLFLGFLATQSNQISDPPQVVSTGRIRSVLGYPLCCSNDHFPASLPGNFGVHCVLSKLSWFSWSNSSWKLSRRLIRLLRLKRRLVIDLLAFFSNDLLVPSLMSYWMLYWSLQIPKSFTCWTRRFSLLVNWQIIGFESLKLNK